MPLIFHLLGPPFLGFGVVFALGWFVNSLIPYGSSQLVAVFQWTKQALQKTNFIHQDRKQKLLVKRLTWSFFFSTRWSALPTPVTTSLSPGCVSAC